MIWTDDQTRQLIAMVRAGYTSDQISEELGVSRSACIAKAIRAGEPFGRPARYQPRAPVPEPPEPVSQPVPTLAPRGDPDFPTRCAHPGCRGVRQGNRRGLCATHEAEYLNRLRRSRATQHDIAPSRRVAG